MNAEQRCERALARITADTTLNAWSFVDHAGAMTAARDSDRRRAQGQTLGPLDGCLVALKANIAVQDWPWDAGVAELSTRRASIDAPLVAKLRAAGAVLLGLTHMDEAALGASGQSWRGPIRLPQHPDYSPGGSSGGAAVAVAAHHCDLAVGTDTLGSVRIPAALCGLIGFKPHGNSLTMQGIEPLHPLFDQPGPITPSFATLNAAWSVLSSAPDVTPESRPPPPGTSPAYRLLGLPEDLLETWPHSMRAAYMRQLAELKALGAPIHCEYPSPELVVLQDAIGSLAAARRAAFALCEKALARHWRLPEGHEADTQHAILALHMSSTLKAMLRYGAALRVEDEQLREANLRAFTQRWHELNAHMRQRFGTAIIWLLPTTPVSGFRHADGPPKDLADWTALANITGWAALSLPALNIARSLRSPATATTPALCLQWVSADLDNASLCRAAHEVTRDLFASRDPDSFSAADMQ